jgi:hypothetical protein
MATDFVKMATDFVEMAEPAIQNPHAEWPAGEGSTPTDVLT